jgi:hypothetical protein
MRSPAGVPSDLTCHHKICHGHVNTRTARCSGLVARILVHHSLGLFDNGTGVATSGKKYSLRSRLYPTADIDYTPRGTYHMGISNNMHLLGLHINANLLLKDLFASAFNVHRNCITLLWWIYGDVDKSPWNT